MAAQSSTATTSNTCFLLRGARRARLIADAFVYAAEHDRRFDDGRLRSTYSAGDIALPPGWMPNNRAGTAPVAAFQHRATTS